MATKLIIDVDTGVDDSKALILALSRSDVEILAITCVNGNVDIDNVCRNTLRVLKVCDRLDVSMFSLQLVFWNGLFPFLYIKVAG